jgi:Zn-dependent peptidase ImmA (M78 family)
MIQSKVKVAGVTYEVKEVEGLARDHDLYGQVTYRNGVIKLDSALQQERKEQVFVHELFHAILYEAGYDEHDEKMVRRVANVLYQVLKENQFNFGEKQQENNSFCRNE